MKKLLYKITAISSAIYFIPIVTKAAGCGVNTDPSSSDYGKVTQCKPGNGVTIAVLIKDITNWVLGFAGALSILFIIYGGIIYMTSSGNEKRISQAKQILTYAIIGLIVVLLSYVIVQFVATGINAIQATG